jgi:hypothetical protein
MRIGFSIWQLTNVPVKDSENTSTTLVSGAGTSWGTGPAEVVAEKMKRARQETMEYFILMREYRVLDRNG